MKNEMLSKDMPICFCIGVVIMSNDVLVKCKFNKCCEIIAEICIMCLLR